MAVRFAVRISAAARPATREESKSETTVSKKENSEAGYGEPKVSRIFSPGKEEKPFTYSVTAGGTRLFSVHAAGPADKTQRSEEPSRSGGVSGQPKHFSTSTSPSESPSVSPRRSSSSDSVPKWKTETFLPQRAPPLKTQAERREISFGLIGVFLKIRRGGFFPA